MAESTLWPCFQCGDAEVLKKRGEKRDKEEATEKIGRPGNDIEIRK